MKGFLVSVLFTLAVSAALAAPQSSPATNKPPAGLDGNRFLFVVDISSRMGKLDAANRQALFDLVYKGISDQMKVGDTFGIWTYTDKVHAGEFPMQTWDPTNRLQLGSQAATFLKQKRYSGDSDIMAVMRSVFSLARRIKDVNVLIISDGHDRLGESPLEEKINKIYEMRSSERRKAKVPFVTALAARDGNIVSGSVWLPSETITLPPPPPSVVQKRSATNTVTPPLNASTAPKQPAGKPVSQRLSDPDTNAAPPQA